MASEVELTPSQFVAIFNQTLDLAYPSVAISGELANFRISKQKWVYFDLKDESSTLKFFGSVYQLPGPLKDGLMLKVRAQPRLHHTYGFSLNVLHIEPTGEGSIKKAAELLQAKLASEGLFDPARKRHLPYPPERIGLITSSGAAAYADFKKVLNARWRGLIIDFVDVQVQGESAPAQIVEALERLNEEAQPPEVIVLIRGGGSPEDLIAFSSEQVTRAVAASRVPTLVAIGHETDISLAELAADKRASTPSNAAELLVPDHKHSWREITGLASHLNQLAMHRISLAKHNLGRQKQELESMPQQLIRNLKIDLKNHTNLLEAYNPTAILKRGYAIVRQADGPVIRSVDQLKLEAVVDVRLARGGFEAHVKRLRRN